MIGPTAKALALASAIALTGCSKSPLPDIELPGLPDMNQFGREVPPRYSSETLCAPVAASNGIAWLRGGMPEAAQWRLALQLASRNFMATYRSGGTAPWGVIQGLERYGERAGWANASLEYRGWRSVDEQYRGEGPLSMDWLHGQLASGAIVLLNLGWYESTLPAVFQRSGGHWVTLQGIVGGKLVLHDPGPWQDRIKPISFRNRVRIAMRDHEGEYRWFPGAVELVDAPSPAGERAFIDGAVSLAVTQKPGEALRP